MPLASLEDVRRHLSEDKLSVDEANVAPFQIEANRIIKAMLSGVFVATVLQSWDTPENTPGLVSSIAGKLIAAYIYREAYSEDQNEIPAYAQALYMEAVNDLKNIRAGTLAVLDANDVPITNSEAASSLDFWPNDNTGAPKFTMDQEFA